MNRLREHRTKAGLTQQQVADQIGIEQVTVSQHELGSRGISASMLSRYAALYGTTLDALWTGAPEERAS